MSNKDGKYEIKIGGKDFEFVVNYGLIRDLEAKLNKGMLDFYINELTAMKVPTVRIVQIYQTSMQAMGDSRFTEDEVGAMVCSDGIMVQATRCLEYVKFIMSCGEVEGVENSKK